MVSSHLTHIYQIGINWIISPWTVEKNWNHHPATFKVWQHFRRNRRPPKPTEFLVEKLESGQFFFAVNFGEVVCRCLFGRWISLMGPVPKETDKWSSKKCSDLTRFMQLHLFLSSGILTKHDSWLIFVCFMSGALPSSYHSSTWSSGNQPPPNLLCLSTKWSKMLTSISSQKKSKGLKLQPILWQIYTGNCWQLTIKFSLIEVSPSKRGSTVLLPRESTNCVVQQAPSAYAKGQKIATGGGSRPLQSVLTCFFLHEE